jgi:hypothetical protein
VILLFGTKFSPSTNSLGLIDLTNSSWDENEADDNLLLLCSD